MPLAVPSIPDSANLTVSAPITGAVLAVSTTQAAIEVTAYAGMNVMLQAIGADVDVAASDNSNTTTSAVVTSATPALTKYVPVRIASGNMLPVAIPVSRDTAGRVWLHAVTPSGSGSLRILRM